MKQIYLKFSMLLLCLVVGLSAFAETKTEGFEKATAATNYQGTVKISSENSDCGLGWEIYYGNVSTTNKITGNNSLALRLYTSNNYGYAKTTTPIEGLTKVAFNAKAQATKGATILANFCESVDGQNWTVKVSKMSIPSTVPSTKFECQITEGCKYFKIEISSESTKPSDSSAQLTIDDVDFICGESPNTYNVNILKDITGGTISANPTSAAEGAQVTLTATPATDYEFTSWNVTNASTNAAITVTNNTFTMPAANVNVSATFTQKKTDTADGSITVVMSSFNAISGNLDDNVSYEAAKGSASTAPAVNSNQIRVYQNGGLFTVTAKYGYKLSSVTIGSAMATTVNYKLDGGEEVLTSNTSISANSTYTVKDLNNTSIQFICKGTTSSSRLYVNYLKVEYIAQSSTYTVNCSSVEGGTIFADPTSAAAGAKVTLTASPVYGYQFSSWIVTNASTNAAITVTNNTFTMPAANVNVSATFETTEGDDIDKETKTVTYNFAEDYQLWDITPSNNNKTSNTDGINMTKDDIILTTQSKEGLKEGTDAQFCCLWSSSGSTPELRMYTGSTLTIAAAHGYKIKSITFSGSAVSSNALPYVQNENGWGTYNDRTIAWEGYENSLSLIVKGNAKISSISVIYESTTSVDPQDPPTPTNSVTFKATNDGSNYWATFSSTDNVTFPLETIITENDDFAELTVYKVFAVGDVFEVKELIDNKFDDAWYLPANYGYLLKSESTISCQHSYTYTVRNDGTFGGIPVDNLKDNMLYPSTYPMSSVEGDNYFYKLSTYNGEHVGFYWGAVDGGEFTMKNANGAYLAVPKSAGVKSLSLESLTTAIKAIENKIDVNAPIYNLAGQRVNASVKGILIQNGKKFYNK